MATQVRMLRARQVGDAWRRVGDVVLATDTNVSATLLDALVRQGWAQVPGNAVDTTGETDNRFFAPAAIFRIRASGASAATVTVTGITGNTTTTLGTLTVPAGGSATDFYDHGHDAYQWTSTATDTVVEVM